MKLLFTVAAIAVITFPQQALADYDEQRRSDPLWLENHGWTLDHHPAGIATLDSSADKAGMINKINVLDVGLVNAYDHATDAYDSAGRAHARLNGAEDRMNVQQKSIETLSKEKADVSWVDQQLNAKADAAEVNDQLKIKVDKEAFLADQRRQDAATVQAAERAERAQVSANQAQVSADRANNTASVAQDTAQRASSNTTRNAQSIKAMNEQINADSHEGVIRSQAVLNASKHYTDVRINERMSADRDDHTAQDRMVLDESKAYTDVRVNGMAHHIENVKREERAGIAGIAALASIPTAQQIRHLNIGAGVGAFENVQAVAIGGSYRFSSSVAVKASFSTTGNIHVGGAGMSYEW